MGSRLVSKSFIYFIGNFSSKFLTSLLIPVYAFYLSTDDLGNFDYIQTIMFILIPIILLAIWEAILRFLIVESDIEKINILISTSVIFTVIAIVIVNIILFYGLKLFGEFERYTFFICLMFSTYSISFVWQYFSRALNKNKLYMRSSILGTLTIFLVTITLLIGFGYGIKGLFIAFILGQTAIFLSIEKELCLVKRVKLSYFDLDILKKMLKFSIPLVLNLTAIWAIAGFGKIITTYRLGSDYTGLYSFAFRFGLIVTLIGNVISMALIEESIIRSNGNDLDIYFSNITNKLIKLFSSICIVALPAINIFYIFISKTEYYNSLNLVDLFLIYALFMTMSTNIGAIFQATSKTHVQFITTVIGAIFTLLVTIISIDKLGLVGVAYGQLFGAFIMMLSRWYFAKRFINFKVNHLQSFFLLVIYLIIAFLIRSNILNITFVFILSIGFVVTYNYKEINEIIALIIKPKGD
jgi:O-antigen/teichoic acid export membrane protein